MVRAEPTNNRTAGIDTNHSTMFTLLLELNVLCEQRWMQFELQNSPSRVFAFGVENKHYHLANLWNRITTEIFGVFWIITLKQKTFFSPIQSWSSNFQKNCSPIQSWFGQNWIQSWSSPVLRHPLILMCFFWGFPYCAPRKRRFHVLYCKCSVLIYKCMVQYYQVCWCNNVALHLCHIHNYYKNQNVKVEYYQVCWCNNVAVHFCHIIMAFIRII